MKTYADKKYGRATSRKCLTPDCTHRLASRRWDIGYCTWCVKSGEALQMRADRAVEFLIKDAG